MCMKLINLFKKKNKENIETIDDIIKINNKILIVDDIESNIDVLTRFIQLINKKIVIETANNGHKALNKLNCEHYRILFLDLKMPIMDGYQVLKKLSEINYKQPIVITTAYDQEILGFNNLNISYCRKPLNIIQIKEIINKYY